MTDLAPKSTSGVPALAARRHPLPGQIEDRLRGACGLAGRGPVVVGVSGGTATFSMEDGPVDSPAPLTEFIADVFGYFT